jgi:two-component system, OmpR family, sensor histidine kinase CiaH
MQKPNRSKLAISLLFAYIILQFLAWEVFMVRQNNEFTEEHQKLLEITSTDSPSLEKQISDLHIKKQKRVYMIVGEGTVFLLLLLYAFYRIRKASNREVELVNQQKNFLLSVTHELKTPIAATKLQLQTLLKHKQLDPEQQAQLLNSAISETNRLNRLIEDVLLANSAEKELLLNKEEINLSELTEQTIANYFSGKKESGSLVVEIEKGIHFKTDKLLFPSVIINLIENAIKYSPEQSEIKVQLVKNAGKIEFNVSDQGSGIPTAEKQKIFEKFYRIGSEDTRKAKGTGLGLYIVKKIVKANGGKIEISDNKPNGSVFKIIL